MKPPPRIKISSDGYKILRTSRMENQIEYLTVYIEIHLRNIDGEHVFLFILPNVKFQMPFKFTFKS